MPARYLLKKVTICPKCNGNRFLQNPAWAAYWKEHSINRLSAVDEDKAWFLRNGFEDFDRLDGLPGDEINCPECGGLGEIVSEIELAAALAEIK